MDKIVQCKSNWYQLGWPSTEFQYATLLFPFTSQYLIQTLLWRKNVIAIALWDTVQRSKKDTLEWPLIALINVCLLLIKCSQALEAIYTEGTLQWGLFWKEGTKDQFHIHSNTPLLHLWNCVNSISNCSDQLYVIAPLIRCWGIADSDYRLTSTLIPVNVKWK